MSEQATCPHGDPICPCPVYGVTECLFQGELADECPSTGYVLGHCHVEGCSWKVVSGWHDGQRVEGECGLLKLGLPPAIEACEEHGIEAVYSMTQARPGLPGWACGWLRSPGNEAAHE